jgi:hypothetical protein
MIFVRVAVLITLPRRKKKTLNKGQVLIYIHKFWVLLQWTTVAFNVL